MRHFPSTSRSVRLRVASVTALTGLIVMYVVLVAFGEAQPHGWHDDEVWMFPSAALGAWVGGYATAGFFGHARDLVERVLAVIGFFIATVIGSALGGVVWSLLGLVLAPLAMPSASALMETFLTGIPFAAMVCVAVVMGMTPMEAPWSVPVWLVLAWAVDRVAVLMRR